MSKLKFSKNTGEQLYEFIKHGDEDHRDWLREAIHAFRENKPRPEQR